MQYKYIVLSNTTLGVFMGFLDSNIVLISLPTIIRDLPGTNAFDAIWFVMAYVLITATALLAFGRLADIYGRVRLYNLGFLIFTVGSALCSAAPNGTALVLFRVIQGIGGSLLAANSAAIITDVFPATERGKALGVNQVAGTAGSVIGLVTGGILTATLGWRSIFWINIPIGGFATVWSYKMLKELNRPERKERLDYIGNLLFGPGLAIFLLGTTFGAISGWTTIDLALMIVGLILLAFFIIVETRIRVPMMDLALFKIRAFSSGILSNLLAAISRGAVLLVLVFYFQGALLLDALTAGLLLIPYSVAFVTIGPLSGALSDKYGSRRFAVTGMLLSAVAFLIFSLLPARVSYNILVIPMVIVGAGAGMFIAPNTASIMNSVPILRRGIASGMSAMLVNTGFLLSLSLTFAVMTTVISPSTLQQIFAGVSVPGGVNLDLFAQAMHRIFLMMAVVSLIASVPAYLGGRKKKKTESHSKSPSSTKDSRP